MSNLRRQPTLSVVVRTAMLWLVGLGRYPKRAILAVTDFLTLSFALWLAMSLRLGTLYVPPSRGLLLILLAAPTIGVATFFQLGLYRLVTRYIGSQGTVLIPVAVGLSALLWALVVLLSGIQVSGVNIGGLHIPGVLVVPRSVVLLYPVIAAVLVWSTRQLAGQLLKRAGIEIPVRLRDKVRSVVIWGAGASGVQLLEALRRAEAGYVPVGFIDTSPTLWGQYVTGLKVFRPQRLAGLIQRHDVKEVLLAIPRARRRERQEALRQLEPLMVAVRTLPAFEELAAGDVTVNDLRPVEAEELLGREPVPPVAGLLAHSIAAKVVLVTGAGGSIGSELVRQILRQKPRRLVLLEAGEAQLYEIGAEAEELLRVRAQAEAISSPEIIAVLGSVLDRGLMQRVIEEQRVETIYHAAAYKHVPIVEQNAVAGLRNNTFGTAILAEVAERCGVERFVLVSTDKAVRPTSIMGASKRLAEMVLQARATHSPGRTVFTMVRFGNVLDSSGSVVRKFRRQIASGGPVTVTDREAIRYFMSIPEAATLVIQAGAMATGGEVFVLDMDDPVRIDDLARSMIRLMGLEVRDAEHPDGDIAIEYIGLRPGEKMHEELLLGENITPTEHPRIFKAQEPSLSRDNLEKAMTVLRSAMDAGDAAAIHDVLARAVEGYRPERREAAQASNGANKALANGTGHDEAEPAGEPPSPAPTAAPADGLPPQPRSVP